MQSSSDTNDQREEKEAVIVPPVACTTAETNALPTIVKQMEKMFLGLGFSQAVLLNLVGDQGIDSSWTLASLSVEDIATICNVIHRPHE